MRQPLACALAALICVAASPAAAQLRPPVADPEAAARAEIERVCLRVEYGADFVRRLDLTGDGLEDVVIRYNVVCDGFGRFFCGVDGCQGDVFVALEEGGFRPMGLSPDVEPAEHEGLPAVAVRHAELDCASDDAPACRTVRVWDGELFVPPSELGRGGERRLLDSSDDGRVRIVLDAGGGVDDVAELGSDAPEEEGQPPNDGLVSEPLPMGGDMPFDGVSPEGWRMRPVTADRAVAWIAGRDGRAGFALSCEIGDSGPRLLIATDADVAEVLPSEQGATLQIDIRVGGRIQGTRIFLYSGFENAWVARLLRNDPILTALAGGSAAAALEHESGAPIARVVLSGARGAIDEMMAYCRL